MGRQERDDRKNAKHDQRNAHFSGLIGKSPGRTGPEVDAHDGAETSSHRIHDYSVKSEVKLTAAQAKQYSDQGIIDRMNRQRDGSFLVVFKKNKRPKGI